MRIGARPAGPFRLKSKLDCVAGAIFEAVEKDVGDDCGTILAAFTARGDESGAEDAGKVAADGRSDGKLTSATDESNGSGDLKGTPGDCAEISTFAFFAPKFADNEGTGYIPGAVPLRTSAEEGMPDVPRVGITFAEDDNGLPRLPPDILATEGAGPVNAPDGSVAG